METVPSFRKSRKRERGVFRASRNEWNNWNTRLSVFRQTTGKDLRVNWRNKNRPGKPARKACRTLAGLRPRPRAAL